MRARALARAVPVAALLALPAPAGAAVREPLGPPPLAFHSVTLYRSEHAIDVHLQAMTNVGVRVTLTRHHHRLGRRRDTARQGQTVVRIALHGRAARRLRAGQHVAVAIEYGGPQPLRAPNAVLRRGRSLLTL